MKQLKHNSVKNWVVGQEMFIKIDCYICPHFDNKMVGQYVCNNCVVGSPPMLFSNLIQLLTKEGK